MTLLGRDDPRDMPPHFFSGSIRLDYGSAVRSDPAKQNCSICPRYWYVDATFPCARCGGPFLFGVAEQRVWYEDYGFWVDSLPRHCLDCRRALRELKRVRQEYDRSVADTLQRDDVEQKRRLADLIDQLYELGGELPPRINEHRRQLATDLRKR
jgi:hypothetical protein